MTIHQALSVALLIQQELIERQGILDVALEKALMRLHGMSPPFEVVAVTVCWRCTSFPPVLSEQGLVIKRAKIYIDEHGKLWPDKNSWSFAVGAVVVAWETQGLAEMIYDQLHVIQGELVYTPTAT